VEKELPSLKLNNLNPAGISKKAVAYQGLEHDQENTKNCSERKTLLAFKKTWVVKKIFFFLKSNPERHFKRQPQSES